jgi:hypothetical protein
VICTSDLLEFRNRVISITVLDICVYSTVAGGTREDFKEIRILMGVFGSVRDLTVGVIAVVKSSAPTCCFSIVVWLAGLFVCIVLDSGAESWSLVTGAPVGLMCVLCYLLYCKTLNLMLGYASGAVG